MQLPCIVARCMPSTMFPIKSQWPTLLSWILFPTWKSKCTTPLVWSRRRMTLEETSHPNCLRRYFNECITQSTVSTLHSDLWYVYALKYSAHTQLDFKIFLEVRSCCRSMVNSTETWQLGISSHINRKPNTIRKHAAQCPSFLPLLCQLHGMHTRVTCHKYRQNHSVSSWHLSWGSTSAKPTIFELYRSVLLICSVIIDGFYLWPIEPSLCLLTLLIWRFFFFFIFVPRVVSYFNTAK